MMKRSRPEAVHCSTSAAMTKSSPVNVVDFTRMLGLQQASSPEALVTSHSLNKPLEISKAIAAALKDSVATEPCSSEEDDDVLSFSSSLSSHSHDEDELDLGFEIQTSASSREEDRRSIFSQYWKTTGQEPLELIREHSHQQLSRSPGRAHLSLLDNKQDPPAPISPRKCPPSPRRTIFGLPSSKNLSSLRSLPEMSALPKMEPTRKTQSASCLQVKRLPSCLRKSERSVSSSSSVSFDAQVKVYTFQTPIENWSDGSWTNIFGDH